MTDPASLPPGVLAPNTHKAGPGTSAVFITPEQRAAGTDPLQLANALAVQNQQQGNAGQGIGQRGIRVQMVSGGGPMLVTPHVTQLPSVAPFVAAPPGAVAPASNAPLRATASGAPAPGLELGRPAGGSAARRDFFGMVQELPTGEVAVYGTAAYGLALAFSLPLQTALGPLDPSQLDAGRLSASPELCWLVVSREWFDANAPARKALPIAQPFAAMAVETSDAGDRGDPATRAGNPFADLALLESRRGGPTAEPGKQAVPPLGAEGETGPLESPSAQGQRGSFGFAAGPELHVVIRGPVVMYSQGGLRVQHSTQAESGTDIVEISALEEDLEVDAAEEELEPETEPEADTEAEPTTDAADEESEEGSEP